MIRLFRAVARYNDELAIIFIGIFLYIAANATQAGWLYFIVSLIIVLLLAAFYFPRASLRGIRIWREVPSYVFEGEKVEISFFLRNESPRIKYVLFLKVRENADYFQEQEEQLLHIHSLRPGETKKATATYTCLKRAKVSLMPYWLCTSFPFGLFAAGAKHSTGECLYIYPLGPEPRTLMEKGGSLVQHGTKRALTVAGRSFDFLGIREYRPDDGTRFIHWPSTARLKRLMVKEFSELGHQCCAIIIDTTRQWGRGRESTLEYGIKLAAGIVNYCSRRDIVLLLGAAEEERVMEINNPSKLQALEFLASIEANGKVITSDIIRDERFQSRGSHLYIIQSALPEDPLSLISSIPQSTFTTVFFIMGCTFTEEKNKFPAPARADYERLKTALKERGIEVILVSQGDDLALHLDESLVNHGNS
jgi:uncharacterized protein (DUF58 family)